MEPVSTNPLASGLRHRSRGANERGEWNSIHAAVKGQMDSGGLKGALLTKAVNTKLARWRETGEVTHPIYDALVFRKVSKGNKAARATRLSESRAVWK